MQTGNNTDIVENCFPPRTLSTGQNIEFYLHLQNSIVRRFDRNEGKNLFMNV